MGGLLREGESVRYAFISAQKAEHNVAPLCRQLRVSRSGYYDWVRRPTSKHAEEDKRLTALIRQAHVEGRRNYGRPMLHEALKKKCEKVSAKRVARLMREAGIKGKAAPRRFARTTDSNHSMPVFSNLLNRDFTAMAPNQRWVGDTTYLRTPSGFIYLAAVLDLYSRAIVGWAVSAVNDRRLVTAALEAAVYRRRPKLGLLFHSDRGSQYASEDHQKKLVANGIVCSMSRRGSCYDNAVMESWFGTLKTELGEDFEGLAEAKQQLFDYIEAFYNRTRMHSTLGYVSPAEFERNADMKAAA
jgi:transposase InsO family protein